MSMFVKYVLSALLAIFSLNSYAEDWPKYEFINKTDEPIQVYWKEGDSCYGVPGVNSPITIAPNQSRILNTQVNSHIGCQIVKVDFSITNTKSTKERAGFRGTRAQNLIFKNDCFAEERYQREFNLSVSPFEATCNGAKFSVSVTKAP